MHSFQPMLDLVRKCRQPLFPEIYRLFAALRQAISAEREAMVSSRLGKIRSLGAKLLYEPVFSSLNHSLIQSVSNRSDRQSLSKTATQSVRHSLRDFELNGQKSRSNQNFNIIHIFSVSLFCPFFSPAVDSLLWTVCPWFCRFCYWVTICLYSSSDQPVLCVFFREIHAEHIDELSKFL